MGQATEALQRIVPVSAVWLGGSYISAKPDPGDLDSVYVVPAVDVNAALADPRRQKTMAIFARNQVKPRSGLRVDTFVLPWIANPQLDPNNRADHPYLIPRGFWDDWWQRCRVGPKNAPPPPESTIPRRGYVEVMVDGFTV